MGPNFDLRISIHPNPVNIYMAIFIDLWPCLFTNSAKLSCSSEVTLRHLVVNMKMNLTKRHLAVKIGAKMPPSSRFWNQ